MALFESSHMRYQNFARRLAILSLGQVSHPDLRVPFLISDKKKTNKTTEQTEITVSTQVKLKKSEN